VINKYYEATAVAVVAGVGLVAAGARGLGSQPPPHTHRHTHTEREREREQNKQVLAAKRAFRAASFAASSPVAGAGAVEAKEIVSNDKQYLFQLNRTDLSSLLRQSEPFAQLISQRLPQWLQRAWESWPKELLSKNKRILG